MSFEIAGRVIKIDEEGENLLFTGEIKFEKEGKTSFEKIKVLAPFFCPLQEGDIFQATGNPIEHEKYGPCLILTKLPVVKVFRDRENIIKMITRALRGSRVSAKKIDELYAQFSLKVSSEKTVAELIDYLSDQWGQSSDEKDSELYLRFYQKYFEPIIKVHEMIQLLNWCVKNVSLRRYWLLGLTTNQARSLRRYFSFLPERDSAICNLLLKNPYACPPVDLDECTSLLERNKKKLPIHYHYAGQIVRHLYYQLTNRQRTTVDIEEVVKMFPDFKTVQKLLQDEFFVSFTGSLIELPLPYQIEKMVVERLQKIASLPLTDDSFILVDEFHPSVEQVEAIDMALKNPLVLITGEAGTGKTRLIGSLANTLERIGKSYYIASFTGKAVAHLRSLLKKPNIHTIHRMIFKVKDQKPFDHLIIDESSMITTELMATFFRKFKFPFRLTLVGDNNQLPPISWGNLFGELLDLHLFPHYQLLSCHRQTGFIYRNVHGIVYEEEFALKEGEKFHFIEGGVDEIEKIVKELIVERGGADYTPAEIKVVSPINEPMREINRRLQELYNLNHYDYIEDYKGNRWRINDRVIMTVNNYMVNIMNGDEGWVLSVNPDEIIVRFHSKEFHFLTSRPDKGKSTETLLEDENLEEDFRSPKVKMDKEGEKNPKFYTSDLELSYGLTVHKSQGSEWNYVIVYIPQGFKNLDFLSRNLVYTALTRGKEEIWLVGSVDDFQNAIKRKIKLKNEGMKILFGKKEIVEECQAKKGK